MRAAGWARSRPQMVVFAGRSGRGGAHGRVDRVGRSSRRGDVRACQARRLREACRPCPHGRALIGVFAPRTPQPVPSSGSTVAMARGERRNQVRRHEGTK